MSYYGAGGMDNNAGQSYYGSSSAADNSTTTQRNPHGQYGAAPAAANVQSWKASSSSSNNPQQQTSYPSQGQAFGAPQQQHHQQQQSAYGGAPQQQHMWNPATSAAAMNTVGTMAAMAMTGQGGMNNDALMKVGQNFFQQSAAGMIPGLESTMLLLRNYFAVDNRYVVRKMKKVLFPFLSKDWQRQIRQQPGPETPMLYEMPVTDENAPDLYIPCMTLITYVLLAALGYGTAGQFDPEVIPDVTSKCFLTQVMEVLAIRLGFYMMQAPVAFLDLFSYTGYKYLGLCINLLVGLLASHLQYGTKAYYACFCWTASAAAFFMFKTMSDSIPLQTSAAGPKREVVLIAVSAAQLASMWFVGQTKYL